MGDTSSEQGRSNIGSFLSMLGRGLDDNVLVTDPDLLKRYSSDWSGKDITPPVAVVRPRDTRELSVLIGRCHDANWPVVVQGGLTGLCGGATPRPGELAVSLERLKQIEEIDTASGYMTVAAGATLASIHEAAAKHQLMFALDLASRGTCTIGGNIATNAGGNRVLRYGTTRQHVLGLEVVLADGRVLSSMKSILKDNAGYDLKQLFIGSEGTLGIVTRAVLRLHHAPPQRMSALVALDSYDDLLALLAALQAGAGVALSSFEVMWSNYVECVLSTLPIARPFSRLWPYYALLEFEVSDSLSDREGVEAALSRQIGAGCIGDAVIAKSMVEEAALWRIREAAGELVARFDPAATFDVSMPLSMMPGFVDQIEARCTAMLSRAPVCAFGHLGDGNLHLLIPLASRAAGPEVDSIVYGALNGAGSVSAEHGIGVAKKSWLGVTRSAAEIDVMRGLKAHFDPRGILNPGRVI